MKLVVFGANGRTGRLVVAAALDRGIRVAGVVRSGKWDPGIRHERLTMVVGDPCDRFIFKKVILHVLNSKRRTYLQGAIRSRSQPRQGGEPAFPI